jgi:hypothetical protein
VPARLVAGKFLRKLCFFVTEKQPTSIAIWWSEPVSGRASGGMAYLLLQETVAVENIHGFLRTLLNDRNVRIKRQ